ncbi:hypothetical protein ACFSTH_17175 [Paenibacillus yanchengensis]|uniref:Uncharacterized protein n=1 Tax=Paenibacillus yanchengensis TaxID=2035833 RepID=A0ABW4YQ45_9BACL
MRNKCQMYRYVEPRSYGKDLTFKFYDDGKLTIIDNKTEEVISPNSLRGASKDFYVRQRISFIKQILLASQLKHA